MEQKTRITERKTRITEQKTTIMEMLPLQQLGDDDNYDI